VLLVATDN